MALNFVCKNQTAILRYYRKFNQHIYVEIHSHKYSHKLAKRSLINAFEWTRRNGNLIKLQYLP